jgi:hypothetical protein
MKDIRFVTDQSSFQGLAAQFSYQPPDCLRPPKSMGEALLTTVAFQIGEEWGGFARGNDHRRHSIETPPLASPSKVAIADNVQGHRYMKDCGYGVTFG